MSQAAPSTAVAIGLTITLITPLCVGATGSSGGVADNELQRDGWGRPIIPGSQIKGRLRHACAQVARALGYPLCDAPYADRMCPSDAAIARAATEAFHRQRALARTAMPRQCDVCALFGSPTYPSPLRFGDAIHRAGAPEPEQPVERERLLRPGIGIDRQRRTVRDELLFLTETTPAGITLDGAISGRWWETEASEIRRLLGLLVAGASLTARWGGGSSRGLGWSAVALQVTIDDQPVDDLLADLLPEVGAP
ncbi:MAG TPA: RAMP superfamily CRISPR-associated protein [Herpetosiphonaceae bacterium]